MHTHSASLVVALSVALLCLLLTGPGRLSHADGFADALGPLVQAHASGNEEEFRAAVGAIRTDPWYVIDDLLTAGRRETAVAFAALIRLPDGDALRRHAQVGHAGAAEMRERLSRAQGGLRAKEYARVLEELGLGRSPRSPVLATRIAYTRGIAHYRLRSPGAALEAYLEAAQGARSLGWLRMEYFSQRSAANMAREHRAWSARTTALQRLADLLDAMGESVRAARVRADVAGLLVQQGDLSKVTDLQRRAHAALSEADLHGDACIVAVNASLVLARRGERAAAVDWLEIANTHLQHDVDAKERSRFSILRAALRMEVGEYEQAIDDLSAALKKDLSASVRHRAATLAQIALAHQRLGEQEEALRRFDEAIQILRTEGDGVAIANIERRQAGLQLARGRSKEAMELLARALPNLRSDPLGQGLARLQLARVQLARKAPEAALASAELAAEDFDQLGARDFQSDAEQVLAEVTGALGRHEASFDHARRSLDHLDEFVAGLSDESMAKARARGRRVFEVGLGAGWDAKKPEWSIAILERWRGHALLDALGGRMRLRGVGLPPDLRSQELDAEATLTMARRDYAAKRVAGRWEDAKASVRAVRAAEATLQRVKQQAQRDAKRVTQLKFPDPLDLPALRKTLRPHEVLVYLTHRGEHIVAVSVGQTGADQYRVARVDETETAFAAFEAAARDPDVPVAKELLRLRKMLGAQLRLPKGTKTVLLCPEGDLCYVPWPALLPSHDVACVPSGTVLAALRGDDSLRGKGILALGNPDYSGAKRGGVPMQFRGRPLSPLPGAEAEVRAIATGSEDKILVGPAATEGALRKELEGRERWRALLLACHGLIHRVHPNLTALALSAEGGDDGFLSIYEILDMEVSADLVVASACDSGQGPVVRGEGVMGLARAFMVAGAPRIIVNLWKADDEATRELMKTFFKQWRAGVGTAAALRAAQRRVRDDPKHKDWGHAYYWAGWVPWGLAD